MTHEPTTNLRARATSAALSEQRREIASLKAQVFLRPLGLQKDREAAFAYLLTEYHLEGNEQAIAKLEFLAKSTSRFSGTGKR